MRRLSKTIALWLLLFALPVQGVAAVTMAACGPLHQRQVPISTDGAQAHDHRLHESSGQHRHSVVVDDVSAAASHQNAKDLLTLTDFSCSACAACCAAAAIASTDYRAPAIVPAANTGFVSPISVFSGFIPETPEHPPRSILT